MFCALILQYNIKIDKYYNYNIKNRFFYIIIMSIIPVNDNFYKISNKEKKEIDLKNIKLLDFSINLQKLIEIKLNKTKPFITLEQFFANNEIYKLEINNYLKSNLKNSLNSFLEIIDKLNNYNEKDYNTNIIELKKLYDNNDKEFEKYYIKFMYHIINIHKQTSISVIHIYIINQIYHISVYFNFLNKVNLKNSLYNKINNHRFDLQSINFNSKLISDIFTLFDYLQKK